MVSRRRPEPPDVDRHPESLTHKPGLDVFHAISSPCQATGEKAHAGDENPGFGARGRGLVVFGEATVASEPSERALDHPSPRLRFERADALRASDDLNRPRAQISKRRQQFRAAIHAAGDTVTHFWE